MTIAVPKQNGVLCRVVSSIPGKVEESVLGHVLKQSLKWGFCAGDSLTVLSGGAYREVREAG